MPKAMRKPRKQPLTAEHRANLVALTQQASAPLQKLAGELPAFYATRSPEVRRIKAALRELFRFYSFVGTNNPTKEKATALVA